MTLNSLSVIAGGFFYCLKLTFYIMKKCGTKKGGKKK